jgi:hypothetical protein
MRDLIRDCRREIPGRPTGPGLPSFLGRSPFNRTKLTITHKTPKVAVKIARQSKRVFQGGVRESRRLGSHPTSIRRRFYKQKVLADLLSNLETRMPDPAWHSVPAWRSLIRAKSGLRHPAVGCTGLPNTKLDIVGSRSLPPPAPRRSSCTSWTSSGSCPRASSACRGTSARDLRRLAFRAGCPGKLKRSEKFWAGLQRRGGGHLPPILIGRKKVRSPAYCFSYSILQI